MSAYIEFTFSGNPQVGDFIEIHPSFLALGQIIETFKNTRQNAGEVEIGATVSDTIENFKNAYIADYSANLGFNIETTSTTLKINYPLGGANTFDETISSNVIEYEIELNYFPYFISEYDNRVDNFKLIIEGKDINFNSENINAVATLSYKDVDNTLEPIRGAQLDIEVDANINKPFDLFLDFRESDFRVKLYRNGILIFLGFLNPEGVSQSYTSINWRAKLTAFDNLGQLKNKEFKYNNELPSEFVILDKCLKQTGLDLPIAFFDDMNSIIIQNEFGVISNYNQQLSQGINERIINPNVFLNDNERYQDCETILKDILQKYNAIIVQQNLEYVVSGSGSLENDLCWVFIRVPAVQTPWSSNAQTQFDIKKITGYIDDGSYDDLFNLDILTPEIETLGTFVNPRKTIGTDGQSGLNAIHKNKNQLIRQTRALQNFRFEHKWIEKESYIFYSFSRFVVLDDFMFQNGYTFNENNKLGFANNPTYELSDSLPYNNVNSFQLADVFDDLFNVPETATSIELKGSAIIENTDPIFNTNSFFKFPLLVACSYYVAGDVYQLIVSYKNDEVYNPEEINSITWELVSSDVNDMFIPPTNFENYAYLIYYDGEIRADSSVNVDFNFELPPAPIPGGTFNFHLEIFRSVLKGGGASSDEDQKYRLIINNLQVNITPPSFLGEGEYYDSENVQDVSSKVDESIEVINADDDTNIFLNGLKRINQDDELVNYEAWTSAYNIDDNRPNLLELTSIERVRLYSKSQNIFSGDIHGYIPYFCRLSNTAYNSISMMFTKWVYETASNTIEAEAMENNIKTPDVNFEKTYIFEDEDKKLID